MEARCFALALQVLLVASLGAGYRTPNFVVNAPSPEMARQIGDAAEAYRRDLAVLWLGEAMPDWSRPCPITAEVSPRMGAGGATSFQFHRGEVYGWTMSIQGSLERILDSVLPHEVTHTIFASHFRQPLPRWADEGACSTVEHPEERGKLEHMLVTFLKTEPSKGIPFSRMFAMKDYPSDMLPLYAQGYALAEFLIADGGRRKYIAFLEDGLADEDWPRAVRKHYGHENLLALQNDWLDWIRAGRPLPQEADPAQPPAGQFVAASAQRRTPAQERSPRELAWIDPSDSVYRGQSPDPAPGSASTAGELTPVRQRPRELVDSEDPIGVAPPAREEFRPTPVPTPPPVDRRFEAGTPEYAPVAATPPVVVLEWVRADVGYVK